MKKEKKKKVVKEYYTFDHMIEKYPDATYYMAFSERGNGKTYDMMKKAVEDYFRHGWQMAYIRRFNESFKGVNGNKLAQDMVRDGIVEKESGGEWTGITHIGRQWFFYRTETKTKRDGTTEERKVINRDPFMIAFALETADTDKGARYDRVHKIFFDEFLTRKFYLQDEFVILSNVISSIVADRPDVKIFMAGNTVSKVACPYFREMGLTGVKKQEQGTIDLYKYGESKLQVAVEYCANRAKSKDNEKYFAFGNPRLKMITDGMWEVAVHPHLPKEFKYAPKDVCFKFFVYFDDELMQCEVVSKQTFLFLYITPKTTPLKYPDNELIYSDKYDLRPNWRRSIYRDNLNVSAKLRPYLSNGRVFFSDNMTGEFFDGYLKWARTNI